MDGRWLLVWLTAVAALIASIHGWSELSVWLKERQELAAWVQAIGSVAAILATGWAVQHAHRLQESQRLQTMRDEYTQLLEAVFQLVGGAHQIARKIGEYIAAAGTGEISQVSARTMHDELASVASALSRVDVTRLDRFEYVQAVLLANAVVPRLLDELQVWLRRVYLSGRLDSTDIESCARETAEILKPFGQILSDAVNQRGGKARIDTFAAR